MSSVDELCSAINPAFPCRDVQLKQLYSLIGRRDFPSPPSFVVHGPEATGKTLALRSLLEALDTSFSWLPCHECITARHLTERIGATVTTALGIDDASHPRCDTTSSLSVYLQKVLKDNSEKHFLVLDRLDQQRDASLTLLNSLSRLGEVVPHLTVITVISTHQQRFLSSESAHVHFPPYTKEESIEILSKYAQPIPRVPDESSDEEPEYTEKDAKDDLWVWQKFCGTVWDSLAKGSAKNIVQFRTAVEKMWIPFVQPIAKGEYATRNYSSLYLRNKEMFRQETSVIDVVLPPVAAERATTYKTTHDLPYYSKFLLCAAYLASYNPARTDSGLFMKSSDTKKRRRGGGRRKASNKRINRRLLGPQGFLLERLMGIFYAIMPYPVSSSADIQAQVATLTSLRLLIKSSAADPLEGIAKWKVNVGWDYIRAVARSVKFDIEDYLVE